MVFGAALGNPDVSDQAVWAPHSDINTYEPSGFVRGLDLAEFASRDRTCADRADSARRDEPECTRTHRDISKSIARCQF
jgi:hypothetical protein